jgi:hypothetical protein
MIRFSRTTRNSHKHHHRMNRAVQLFTLCLVGMCQNAVGQSSFAGGALNVRICEVLKHPETFDGREIVVTGVAGNSLHSVLLWEPECSLPKHGGAMQIRLADVYKRSTTENKKFRRILNREGAVRLTVKGRFIATGGPFGPNGVPYEFIITSIMDVQKLSGEYRQQHDIGTGKGP